jgi:hypothetical protein
MIVWGRVNLHKMDREDESDRFPLLGLLLLLDRDDDTDSESRKTSLLWPLSKFWVVNGYVRDTDRAVNDDSSGTKAEENVDGVDPFVAPDHDPSCNETKKKKTVDNNSCRNKRDSFAPANIFGFERWSID